MGKNYLTSILNGALGRETSLRKLATNLSKVCHVSLEKLDVFSFCGTTTLPQFISNYFIKTFQESFSKCYIWAKLIRFRWKTFKQHHALGTRTSGDVGTLRLMISVLLVCNAIPSMPLHITDLFSELFVAFVCLLLELSWVVLMMLQQCRATVVTLSQSKSA